MLTAKKRAFIDYYKLHRNATEAAKLAGYSPHTATNQTTRLLKDVDISKAIAQWEAEERIKVAELVPSKQSFVMQTFTKAKEVIHPPTAAKYWELGGKALGYINEEEKQEGDTIQIICRELNLIAPTKCIENKSNQFENKSNDIIDIVDPLKVVTASVVSATHTTIDANHEKNFESC